MKAFLLLLILCVSAFGYTANDGAKTIASDGTVTDFNDANTYVAGKAEDGWVHTVGTPGGLYTWTAAATCSVANIYTIQGATSSTRDTTTRGFVNIGCPTITSTVSSGTAISINCTENKTVTIKNLIFAEWNNALGRFTLVSGAGRDCVRFTNIKWIHDNQPACVFFSINPSGRTEAGPYGLIDHCQILGSGYGFFVRDNDSVSSWDRVMSFGGRDAVYVEDSVFGNMPYISGRPVIDSDNGSRWVFRYNTVTDQTIGNHGADQASTALESSLQAEVMHNTFLMTIAGVGGGPTGTFFCFVNMRGGTNYIFDNSFTGEYVDGSNHLEAQAPIREDYYRADGSNGLQDRNYPADYVGTMQPGAGHVGAAGQDPIFPLKLWGSVPIHIWSNTASGVFYSFAETPSSWIKSNVKGTFLQLNRDWFESNDATAAPVGYTELTYPHPLQGGADLTPPTLVSATVNGSTLTLAFSETVTTGAGGNGGWTISMSGGAETLNYVSPTSFTMSRVVSSSETGTISYAQPGNGFEDTAGNDLVTISSASVVNSTPASSPVSTRRLMRLIKP